MAVPLSRRLPPCGDQGPRCPDAFMPLTPLKPVARTWRKWLPVRNDFLEASHQPTHFPQPHPPAPGARTSALCPPRTERYVGRSGPPHRLHLNKQTNKRKCKGFPGGAVVENLPANAGDTGSSPGLGRSHMPRTNWAREPQLLSLTSPVAQWLRIRLPMQGTRVRTLVQEDPTRRGATKPVHHNY
ncbi:hypothetical protein J1605_012691 [Eschrichtius robustus]|uniref:Uncharacterized protein n=1 Tax=Eschrichtius robustus TaxID=9764 RepID=A0AB34GIG8_ESCRO|nr:hypothetical protein J1605_012691 [Eschrichtius robustus]